MCGSFCFEYFFKLHILKCKGHQKMETRISEKKVKSLLLPKDATNFSMRFAFVRTATVSEAFFSAKYIEHRDLRECLARYFCMCREAIFVFYSKFYLKFFIQWRKISKKKILHHKFFNDNTCVLVQIIVLNFQWF
jgi:hypothetical protein